MPMWLRPGIWGARCGRGGTGAGIASGAKAAGGVWVVSLTRRASYRPKHKLSKARKGDLFFSPESVRIGEVIIYFLWLTVNHVGRR